MIELCIRPELGFNLVRLTGKVTVADMTTYLQFRRTASGRPIASDSLVDLRGLDVVMSYDEVCVVSERLQLTDQERTRMRVIMLTTNPAHVGLCRMFDSIMGARTPVEVRICRSVEEAEAQLNRPLVDLFNTLTEADWLRFPAAG